MSESTEPTAPVAPEEAKAPEMIVGPDGVSRTKNEHKKYMKKVEKDAKKQEHKAKKKEEKGDAVPVAAAPEEEEGPDYSVGKYGETPLCTSQLDPNVRFEKKYTPISKLNGDLAGEKVLIRARCHNTRPQGKGCFVILREEFFTVQTLMFKTEEVSP